MRTLLAVVLAWSSFAAAQAVVLFEFKVTQFQDAAAGVKSALPVVAVDVAAPDAAARVSGAPLIIAIGQKALQLARDKAPKTPTVFCLTLGVTREQLGDTVTGVPFEPDPADTLARIRRFAPAVTKVGLLYNPAASDWFVAEAQQGAKAVGLTLITRSVSSAQQARDAARQLIEQTELLWLPPDPKLFPKDLVVFLLTSSAERSVPVVGFLDSMAQAGALASLSADFAEVGRRAGKLGAEVMANPEGRRTPVPPPVFAPGRFTLNLKTADTLHIKPTAAAIAEAAQVIK